MLCIVNIFFMLYCNVCKQVDIFELACDEPRYIVCGTSRITNIYKT